MDLDLLKGMIFFKDRLRLIPEAADDLKILAQESRFLGSILNLKIKNLFAEIDFL